MKPRGPWRISRASRATILAAFGRPPTRRAALEALCSFEAWDQLRRGQELAEPDATVVVSTAIVDLLG